MPTGIREKLLNNLKSRRDQFDQAIKFVSTADEDLLRVLGMSFVENVGSDQSVAGSTAPTQAPTPNAKDTPASGNGNGERMPLTPIVRAVIHPMEPGRKFDVHDVFEAVKQNMGSSYPRPKAAIGDVLRKMVGKSIKVLQQGAGTTATIYQKLS